MLLIAENIVTGLQKNSRRGTAAQEIIAVTAHGGEVPNSSKRETSPSVGVQSQSSINTMLAHTTVFEEENTKMMRYLWLGIQSLHYLKKTR